MSLQSQARPWQALRRAGFAILLAGAASVGSLAPSVGWAKGSAVQELASVAIAELPKEAQTTDRLIRAGGPFPYPKDGIVFGNRERVLPAKPRGYYREYTVKTPGERNRGARRIVCGGREATRPDACFYTGDHYASFRVIVY